MSDSELPGVISKEIFQITKQAGHIIFGSTFASELEFPGRSI